MALESKPLSIANVHDGQTISLESGYAWSSDGKERFTPNYPNDNLMKNTLKPSIGNTPPSSITAPVDSSTLPCPVGYSATFSGGRIDIFETSHVRYTTVASQSGASEKYYRFCTPSATNIDNKLVPFEAGKTYEISMDIKASLGKATLNWRGQWYNGSGWDYMDGWHAERVYGNGTHYSRISKTFTIPEGAKGVYFSLQLYGADGSPNTVPNGAWFQFTNLKVSEGGKDASYPYTVSSTEDEQNVYPTYRGERQQPKPINPNQVQGTLFKTPWVQTWNSAGGTVETTPDGIKLTANSDGQTGIGAPLWNDIPTREGLYVQFEARGTARGEVYLLVKEGSNTLMAMVALEETNWRKCGFYFENPISYSNILNFTIIIRGTGAWIEIKEGTLKVERMGETINQGKPNMFSWNLWRSSDKETIVSVPVIKIQGKPNTWYNAESNIPERVGATVANPYFDAFVYNSSETAPNSNTNGLGASYKRSVKTNDDGIINLGLRGGDTESLGHWVAIREQKAPSEWSLEPHEIDNAPSYKWTRWSGKDGASVKSTKTEWAINTSSVDEPTTGWSTTIPTLQKGKYLWTRTTWKYTDSTTSVAYTVNYIPVDGSTGNGVKSIAVTYAVGTSGTTQPSTGWQATPPNVTGGQYLWTRIIWTFTDNSNQTTYSVARFGQDGISVTGTQSEYVQTTSSVEPTSGWSATRPTPKIGMWLWVRSRNTLSNGTYTNWVVTSSYTGRDSIFISATAPSNPTTGTLWQKPNDPTVLKWNGTAWENWGMSINNIVADNVIAENGMFKKVSGVEIVGSTIRNPYNVKYSDNSTGSGEITLENSQIKNNIKQYSSTGVFKNAHSQIMAANYILMATTNEAGNTNYNQLYLDPDALNLQTFSSNPNSGGNGYGAEYSSTGLRLTDSRVSLGNSKLEIHDLIKVETTILDPASGWQRYSEVMGYTNTPTATRVGRTVQIAGAFKPINQLSAGQYIINQPLPVWARPLNNVTLIHQGSGMNRLLLEVRKDGAILVSRYGTTVDSAIPSGAWINISCVYAGQDLF